MKRALLLFPLLLAGCHMTAAQAGLVEGLAEAGCEGLLPLATALAAEHLPPSLSAVNFGPLDLWACKTMGAALDGALAPQAPPQPAITPASGSASWGPGSARPLCAVREAASRRLIGLAPTGVALRDGYVCGALR